MTRAACRHSCYPTEMHFLDVLVTSISQLLGSLFPSANERQTEIAVRIALVIIILLLLFTPIYLFLP